MATCPHATACPHVHAHNSSDAKAHPSSPGSKCSERMMAVFKAAIFLALAGYAGYYFPDYFLPSMGGGALIGVYMLCEGSEEEGCPHQVASSGCQQDLVVTLTNKRLPSAVAVVGAAVIFWEHLDHLTWTPVVFGVHVGVVVVLSIADCVRWCSRKNP